MESIRCQLVFTFRHRDPTSLVHTIYIPDSADRCLVVTGALLRREITTHDWILPTSRGTGDKDSRRGTFAQVATERVDRPPCDHVPEILVAFSSAPNSASIISAPIGPRFNSGSRINRLFEGRERGNASDDCSFFHAQRRMSPLFELLKAETLMSRASGDFGPIKLSDTGPTV